MFNDENNRSDALGERLQKIGGQMNPPPALKKAAKTGVPLRTAGIRYTAGTHIRKFSKAVLLYAAGIALFLGAILLIPRWFGGNEPTPGASVDPIITSKPTETTAQTECEHEFVCTSNEPINPCIQDKVDIYTCIKCGFGYDAILSAPGHFYENGVCTVCGEPRELDPDADCEHDMDPATCPYCLCDEHVWITSENTATCTEGCRVVNTCIKCGYSFEEWQDALGHDFADGICSRCGIYEATSAPWEDIYHSIEPVGTVPEAFQAIVEENLFYNATAFADCWILYESTSNYASFSLYSAMGELKMCYTRDGMWRIGAAPTSDSGALAHYVCDDDNSLLLIKLSAKGAPEWELQIESPFMRLFPFDMYEREDGYYLFGTSASEDNIVLVKLSKSGEILDIETIGGSAYDQFDRSEESGENFVLYCRVQSIDGDFSDRTGQEEPYWNNCRITVNSDFDILSIEPVYMFSEYFSAETVGVLNGSLVKRSDERLADYDAGTVRAVMDYGDQYLVVSRNITGIQEYQPPALSSLLYYTEEVYSMYSEDGTLLWRAAKDTSSNYNAIWNPQE